MSDISVGLRRLSPRIPGRSHVLRRGSILILAYLITTYLTILTAAGMNRSITETRAATQFQVSGQSFHLAESGIDRALLNLRGGDFTGVATTVWNNGTYSSNVQQLPGALIFQIDGQGINGPRRSNIEVITQLIPESVFNFALFGYTQADVQGSAMIDSFNSLDDPYDPTNPGDNGDVGTNSTSLGGVTLSGSIDIHGQVAVGAGADPEDVVVQAGTSITITGDPPFAAQSTALMQPTEGVPTGMTCSDLTLVGNQSLVLPAGTYCYNDVNLTGRSSLSGNGLVKVYITGSMSLAGNIDAGMEPELGDPDDPTNMTIVLIAESGPPPTAAIGGNSILRAAVYAPQSTVTVTGNSEVFGSIIANRVIASGNAKIHYDQALGTLSDTTGFYTANILSWQQED